MAPRDASGTGRLSSSSTRPRASSAASRVVPIGASPEGARAPGRVRLRPPSREARDRARADRRHTRADRRGRLGFRPRRAALKRAIQRLLENPLALQLLEGRFAEADTVRANAALGEIRSERVHAPVIDAERPRRSASSPDRLGSWPSRPSCRHGRPLARCRRGMGAGSDDRFCPRGVHRLAGAVDLSGARSRSRDAGSTRLQVRPCRRSRASGARGAHRPARSDARRLNAASHTRAAGRMGLAAGALPVTPGRRRVERRQSNRQTGPAIVSALSDSSLSSMTSGASAVTVARSGRTGRCRDGSSSPSRRQESRACRSSACRSVRRSAVQLERGTTRRRGAAPPCRTVTESLGPRRSGRPRPATAPSRGA